MTIFFFVKMFEIWWIFYKWNKKLRKYFLLLRQLDVNREWQILTIRNGTLVIGSPCVKKTTMILNFNKVDLFQIISPQSDGKIWWKCSHEDFASVWIPLTRWLSRDVPKRRCLVSGLTKSWTVVKFGNTLAMRNFFFCKCWRFDGYSINGIGNWENVFYFEDNCIWIKNGKFSQSGQDTWNRQSLC